jgi:hypothetical protein
VAALLVFIHQSATDEPARHARRGKPASRRRTVETCQKVARETAVQLVDALLFVDEAALAGPSRQLGFAAVFSARGPTDANGRSLRQLDLRTRLLRYPAAT